MIKTIKFLIFSILLAGGIFLLADFSRAQTATDHVVISEVQITGGAGKTENDFIEFYNPNSANFNLKGYRLVKRTKTGTSDTNIKSWTSDVYIPTKGYYLWTNSGYTDIPATPNAITTATISDDNGIAIRFGAADTGTIIDSVAWGKAQNAFVEGSVFPTNPGANQSLERRLNLDTNDNSADFFPQPTPSPQSSQSPAEPPLATDSNNSDNFGYANNQDSASEINVSSGFDEPMVIVYPKGIIINEILPNPDGSDTENEFIELKNTGSQKVDLSGWKLGDNSSRLFTIYNKDFESTEITPDGFLVFYRSKTKIALNNTSEDGVKFYQPDDQIADSMKYGGKIPEGQSYSRADSGKWAWTSTITPGRENNWPPEAVINGPATAAVRENIVFDASDSSDLNGDSLRYLWNFSDVGRELEGARVSRIFDKDGQYKIKLTVIDEQGAENMAETSVSISINDGQIKNAADVSDEAEENATLEENEGESGSGDEESGQIMEEDGETLSSKKDVESVGGKIKVKGIVSAEPKILGQQIFYLAGPDIQIYMFKKDFPDLKLGDEIEVAGVKSESGGESRIKLSSKDDIKILNHQSPPQPKKISAVEINENTEGCLVEVTGMVTEIKSNTIYLDDGNDEVRVYIKDSTGIGKPEFDEGDIVRMAGIVSQTTSGYRLLPRYPSDIEVQSKADQPTREETKEGFLIAASADDNSGDIYIPANQKSSDGLIKYLSATAGALFIILMGLIFKNKLSSLFKKKDQPPEKTFTVTIEE